MKSFKYYNINRNQSGGTAGRVEATSNIKEEPLKDESHLLSDKRQSNLAQEKAGFVEQLEPQMRSQTLRFKKNMTEKQVRVNLFITEGEDLNFQARPIRAQIQGIVRTADKEVVEWIYDCVAANELPETWEEFRKRVIEFCTGKELKSVRKFTDEPWSSYISRLLETAKENQYSTRQVYQNLLAMKSQSS